MLTLRLWGHPSVALLGTHVSTQVLEQLRTFQRVYLALDQDDADLEATLRIADRLGPTAVPVALPDGVKDISELGRLPGRRAAFAAALLEATGGSNRDAPLAEERSTSAHAELRDRAA